MAVNPEILEQHFAQLAEQSAQHRVEVLQELAREQPELAQRLAALLDAHDRDTAGLGALGAEALRRVTAFDPDSLKGRKLGRYRLMEPIGRGGMGVVYAAERDDDGIVQTVAVKLLSSPIFDPATAERFRREANALARLDHPDVCRLRDWGRTEEGWAYLVLDRVHGDPIDRHAAKLPVVRRLALMVRVCRAVAAAHRQLIVHLDIKPENILVDDAQHPVLLDFGVAGILSAETGAAATMTRWMTPDYASPEQLRGEPATVAADVYALGALLYRLLTGKRAFELSGVPLTEAIARIERGAMPPSRVVDGISRDLDAVCKRAMHPDPAQRYAGADALAEDILAVIESRPVRARPDTMGYRLRKLLQRHPVAMPAGALAAVSIASLTVLLSLQAADLRQQRDRAERAAVRARSATDLLLGSIKAANPSSEDGADLRLSDLLEITSRRIDLELDASPGLRAEALVQLADVRRSLSQHDKALPLYEQARALMGRVDDAQAAETRLSIDLGEADALHRLDRLDEAMAMADTARANVDAGSRWRVLMLSGGLHTVRGEHEQGEHDLVQALAEIPDDQPVARAEAMNDLGSLFSERGRHAESLDWYRKAIALLNDVPRARELRALIQTNLANDLSQLGEVNEAADHIQQALDTRMALYGERHFRTVETLMYQAGVMTELGHWDDAVATARRALAIEQDLNSADSLRAGHIWTQIGTAMDRSRRFDQSMPAHAKALEIFKTRLAADNVSIGMARNNLATAMVASKDYQGSIEQFEQAFTIFEKAANGEPSIYLAIIAANIAYSSARVGAQPAGIEWATRGFKTIEGLLPAEHFVHAHIRNIYADNLLATGNVAEAETQALAAEAAFAASANPVSPKSLEANARVLLAVYQAIGRSDLVAKYQAKVDAFVPVAGH